MSNVGANIHQMGDAITTLTLGIALEELANLEEEHDKHCLGVLRLSTRQETDAEGTDGGDRHEEVLVEGVALKHTLDSLFQRVVTNEEVRNEVD